MDINDKGDAKGIRLLLAGLAMPAFIKISQLPLRDADMPLIVDAAFKVADAMIERATKE